MKLKHRFHIFIIAALLMISAGISAQVGKPRIAFVTANIAFHVPELQSAAARLKDTMAVSLFGYNSKDLAPLQALDPALFDVIIIEKSDVQMSDWHKMYDALLKTKKVYVNEALTFEGNLKPALYPEFAAYIANGGTENAHRLFQFTGKRFFELPLAISPPVQKPKMAFYHPDAPNLFYTLADYERWYGAKKQDKLTHTANSDSLSVGIVFSSFSYIEKNILPVDSLIRCIERKGHNAYALMRSGNADVDTLLMLKGETKVDAVIMVLSSLRFVDYESGIRQLQKINVPLLSAMNHLDYTPEQWENSIDGLTLGMGSQLTPMFKDGIFEPMVISGSIKNSEGKRISMPIMYQLEWRVNRALAWARLHRMKNADKRMMITFYSEDGGKANVGSHPANYFNAPASIVKLLTGMKERGWNIGSKPIPNAAELARMLAFETSNVGNWAQGEINRRAKNNSLIMIPEGQYLQWFHELPADKQFQMTQSWGEAPGNVMVYTNSGGERFITIPKLQFGNVLLAPNPDWGYLQNSKMLYSNSKLPPSHQYYAFYCWFQKIYQPHVRFSIFNNLEVMEHKFTGPSKKDWLGLMTGDYPNIHINGLMSGEAGKEIMSDLPITYFNTIVPSGLNPNLNELRLKIKQLSDQVIPELKKELRNGIIAETKRLKLDERLHLNADLLSMDSLLSSLANYFYEIDTQNMPAGTHTLGEVPQGRTRVAMIQAMLGPEFEQILRPYLRNGRKAGNLLNDVLIKGKDILQSEKYYLTRFTDSITTQLDLALEYQRRILASSNEVAKYLDAFEGKYIAPSSTDDPVRNPDALPTGRNPYSFDAETAPTREAWAIATRLGDDLIKNYLETNHQYPRKVGFVLWASELLKNHGVLEAEILYLMGTRPLWDSKSNVVGVELIPKDSLNRPRIDVVATTSGDYRDVYRDKAMLIEDAVKLVASLDEEGNQVRKNSLQYIEQLKNAGKSDEDAKRLSTVRVFSPALGTYSTSLQNVTKANDTWKSDTSLSSLYLNRMGHVYGKETMGEFEREYFVSNLQSVDAGAFSRSSNVGGLLDGSPEPIAFFGGLQMAIRNAQGGRNIEMYINDLRSSQSGKLEKLGDYYQSEMQSRAFNPKWIEAMMKDDYNGAHYMQNITENLWAFNVTSPDMVKDKDWNEMNEVFIKDKFKLGLNDFFEKANPYAKQTILATMLGAAEKGYWKADKEVLVNLSRSLAESVAKNGAGCSSVICNTNTIKDFAVMNLEGITGGQVLAENYIKGINQQTGVTGPFVATLPGTATAPSNAKAFPTKSSKKRSARSSAPAKSIADVPEGNTIQGNEIVTTSVKKLSGNQSRTPSVDNKLAMILAMCGLTFICVLGWMRQGLRWRVSI